MTGIPSKYYLPFADALVEVLQQFGVSEITKNNMELKKSLYMDYEVCLIVGITNDVQGNIGISMPTSTAINIASIAMGGMEITEMDDMSQSALSEISNMVAATATRKLSDMDKNSDITPPTMVMGEKLMMIISQVDTISLSLKSAAGVIQLDIGLENVS